MKRASGMVELKSACVFLKFDTKIPSKKDKCVMRAHSHHGVLQAGGSISIACDTVIPPTAATPDAVNGPLRIDWPGFFVKYINQTTSYPGFSYIIHYRVCGQCVVCVCG